MIVADYKATSKGAEITLDAKWQDGYKRQMEFCQWLLRRQGLAVSDRGWFVYCNGKRDLDAFNNHLEFRVKMIPYEGDDAWVEPVLTDIRTSLEAAGPPPPEADCEYCAFAEKATKA